MTGLRIGIIAASRFPVAEPFAGGLESHVWGLADGLRRRGHDVTLFAAPGSDPDLHVELLDLHRPRISAAARDDVSMSAPEWLDEHHAYLELMVGLGRTAVERLDVIHNHSLHYLPIAMAPTVGVPMVCTLHTPPTPWLESAIQIVDDSPITFVAVSEHTARAWSHLAPSAHVIHNGVDITRWRPGRGGGPAVWFGRITPEKGTHLAIDAALRAERPLVIAGPIGHRGYYEDAIRPRLGHAGIRYAGHLARRELVALVGDASAALVTPCWDEPYGLVVAEALACGTPVCAFARGALPEILNESVGRLVAPGDTEELARALLEVPLLARSAARAHAVEHCSLERMVDAYDQLYGSLCGVPA